MADFNIKISNRNIKPILFISFSIFNIITVFGATLPPAFPEELETVATSMLLIGLPQVSVSNAVNIGTGFIQSLLYTPILLITKDPYIFYKICLITNALIVSFAPVIAYSIISKLGVTRQISMLLISISIGILPVFIGGSKLLSPKTVSLIMVLVLAYMLLKVGFISKKVPRAFFSVLLAFALAVTFFADYKLLPLVFSVLIVIIVASIIYHKQLVTFAFFVPAFIFFMLLGFMVQNTINGILLTEDATNTLNWFLTEVPYKVTAQRFIAALCDVLFYFLASTWGIGAVALALIGVVLIGAARKKSKTDTEYSPAFVVFSLFLLICFVSSVIFDALYITADPKTMFGTNMDMVVPLMMILFLCFVAVYELNFRKVVGGVLFLCGIYFGTFYYSYDSLFCYRATNLWESAGLAMLPYGTILSKNELFTMVSLTLCIMSLLIVLVSCGKRYRSLIITCFTTLIFAFSAFHVAVSYTPLVQSTGEELNIQAENISEALFNTKDAPPAVAYKIQPDTLKRLQYLNQNINFTYTTYVSDIKENTFLILPSTFPIYFLYGASDKTLVKLNTNSGISVYAYGERAVAYAQSQGVQLLP